MDLRSSLATALRFGLGARVGSLGPRPSELPKLYEFETCPFCRKVREVLVWLDLDVLIYPCPPGGTRHRPGRGPFPFLIDAEQPIRGSSQIVAHLASRYGHEPVPWALRLGPLTTASSSLASALLPPVRALPSRPPAHLLELFSDETSAPARLVRTSLCALEIPYRWRCAGRGSTKLAELLARTGSAELPALIDGDLVLRGATPIVQHLRNTYAA